MTSLMYLDSKLFALHNDDGIVSETKLVAVHEPSKVKRPPRLHYIEANEGEPSPTSDRMAKSNLDSSGFTT